MSLFELVTDALAALTLGETTVDIGLDDNLSVYVGGVDWNVEPSELQQHFAPCGAIKEITIPVHKWTGKSKGYAYIDFANQVSKANILLLDQSTLRGRVLTIREKYVKSKDEFSVYVGGIDWSAEPADLQQYFASCGAIKRVTIPVDSWSGRPRGYAYMEFTNNVDKGNMMLLDQSTFRGRVLAVRDKRTNIPGFNFNH